jgi:hypothetical protein
VLQKANRATKSLATRLLSTLLCTLLLVKPARAMVLSLDLMVVRGDHPVKFNQKLNDSLFA